jgi:hypothetical protein
LSSAFSTHDAHDAHTRTTQHDTHNADVSNDRNVWRSIRKDIEKANRKEADKKKAVAYGSQAKETPPPVRACLTL